MKNQENFDYPFGQCLGSLGGRLTHLHGFVTGIFFSDRIMRMRGEWEEFSGNK
jgi:hypothetical protein